MSVYELVEYELYGNDKDEFEVNDVYKFGVKYEISDEESDEEIIHRMCTEEKVFPSVYSIHGETRTWLKPEAEPMIQVIGAGDEFAIEFELKNGKPIGRLELVGYGLENNNQ